MLSGIIMLILELVDVLTSSLAVELINPAG